MATRQGQKTDAAIQQEVLQELRWDARVEETDVGVAVDEGIVTLTGTVSSLAKKLAAQEAAHRVRGVRDVANDLTVKIPGFGPHTDTEIAHAVRRALEADPLIPHDAIVTTVSDGWVTLGGYVPRCRHVEDAERAVRHLVGVRGITNDLSASPPQVEPAVVAVRTAIVDALERHADRLAERIHVAVQDGTVTLAGQVHTRLEKQVVLQAVGQAPGVWQVDDQLFVEPAEEGGT